MFSGLKSVKIWLPVLCAAGLAQHAFAQERDDLPEELRILFERGGWTPTLTKSVQYAIGNIHTELSKESLVKGSECFRQTPEAVNSTEIEIVRHLQAGFRIPLGRVEGKVGAKKYRQLTYSETYCL